MTENYFTQQDASEAVEKLLSRLKEQDEIFETLKPLFYTLSVVLYGPDGSDVSLNKLVEDSVNLLKTHAEESLQNDN